MRCSHCPAPSDDLCRGEQTPHFCNLVNPDHLSYAPAYIRILVRDDVVYTDESPHEIAGDESMPPLATQATNLWRSARAFAASGGKLASKPERARRLEICRACPKWNGFRCTSCGCATVVKAYSAAESCPLSPPKWGPISSPAE